MFIKLTFRNAIKILNKLWKGHGNDIQQSRKPWSQS